MKVDQTLQIINRSEYLFTEDLIKLGQLIDQLVEESSFLVLGSAGSIGQAVTKEIFKRNPAKLHLVDISENNLVELVRDLRSSFGYIDGEFKTFALDIGSKIYDTFIQKDGDYDYVLNLSALKHVRSEKDPFTLMRMIQTNILNTTKTIRQSDEKGARKYFCVSTDKAANPVNMMGASKRIMEMFAMRESERIDISMARFANVAFSDGSLLHGFTQRLAKKQPIVAPNDVRRYFITPQESGELCLLSCLLGENRDIFFPKLSEELHLTTFPDIAVRYLEFQGYEPFLCSSEDEARERINDLPAKGKWPCLFSMSDTTGEKGFEEFFTDGEDLNMDRFQNLGVIRNGFSNKFELLDHFEDQIESFIKRGHWNKQEILDLFYEMIPDFGHKETGRYLDAKM